MATLTVHHIADATTTVVVVSGAGDGRHDAVVSLDGGAASHRSWAGQVAAWSFPGRVARVAVSVDGSEPLEAEASTEALPC